MNDVLDVYNRFDDWTNRTGILDGSGLTWIVRIPLNLVLVLVSLITMVVVSLITRLIKKNTKKEARNG